MVPCTKTHLLALNVPPKGLAQTLAFNQESSEAQMRKWRYYFILHCSQSPCVWQIFRLSVPFGVVSLFSWSKQMDPSCTKYRLSCFPYIALHYQQIAQPRDQLRTRSSTLLFPPLWGAFIYEASTTRQEEENTFSSFSMLLFWDFWVGIRDPGF